MARLDGHAGHGLHPRQQPFLGSDRLDLRLGERVGHEHEEVWARCCIARAERGVDVVGGDRVVQPDRHVALRTGVGQRTARQEVRHVLVGVFGVAR